MSAARKATCRIAWLWRLHSAGLLSASFQSDSFTEELGTYNRHRKSLIATGKSKPCLKQGWKLPVKMNWSGKEVLPAKKKPKEQPRL